MSNRRQFLQVATSFGATLALGNAPARAQESRGSNAASSIRRASPPRPVQHPGIGTFP